jgi:hypothetical protein
VDQTAEKELNVWWNKEEAQQIGPHLPIRKKKRNRKNDLKTLDEIQIPKIPPQISKSNWVYEREAKSACQNQICVR